MSETQAPLKDTDVYALFEELGLETHTVAHEAAFTVDQAKAVREAHHEEGHIKNLFLRDKKKNIWLATVLEERPVDLKALKGALDARGNLSFGSSDLLMECLGVIPGAVTPLGAINDRDGRVTVVLDKAIFDHNAVHVHPLRNDRTTRIGSKDLVTFLEHAGHTPVILDFDALTADIAE